jgi:hypothetical protein
VKYLLLILCALKCFAGDSFAQTSGTICLEIQPGQKYGKDAVITTQVPTANYGFHEDFEADTWTCQGSLCLGRSLMQFDLSAIAATAQIDSAFLFLYVNMNAPNGIAGLPTYGSTNAGYLRRITQSWNDQSVTWNTQPATTVQDQVLIPASTSTSEDYILDVKNLVQVSVQNPATSFGFMIMEQDEINYYNCLIFGSSDSPDMNIHPKLKVCFTDVFTGTAEAGTSGVVIYPNPFTDSFTIRDNSHVIRKFQLFNTMGALVFSLPDNSAATVSVDAAEITPGLYFARILTDKGSVVRMLARN